MNPALERAEQLLALRRHGDAEAIARAELANAPDDARALRTLGEALLNQDRFSEAMSVAKAAVHADPESVSGLLTLADACRRGGDQAAAIAAASAAVTIAPTLWSSYYTRAHARLAKPQPDPKAALADAQEAVRLAPHSAAAQNMLGMCLSDVRKPKLARAAYREALRLDPTDAFALNNLAVLDLGRGRLGSASRHLTAGLAEAPHAEVLRRNFDVVLLHLLRRFWWLLLAIGVVEAVALATDQLWWVRAGIGLVATALVVWIARRALRDLPRGTRDVLRGLWSRSAGRSRLLVGYWSFTFCCICLLAFAPAPVAVAAGVVLLSIMRLVGLGLIVFGVVRRAGRLIGR